MRYTFNLIKYFLICLKNSWHKTTIKINFLFSLWDITFVFINFLTGGWVRILLGFVFILIFLVKWITIIRMIDWDDRLKDTIQKESKKQIIERAMQ